MKRIPPPPPPPPNRAKPPMRMLEREVTERTKPSVHAPAHHDGGTFGDSASRDLEGPILEVVVHHEDGAPAPEAWRAFEVWTRNRVYVLDAGMICIEVIDLETRREEGEHPVLGGRLIGGQRTDGETTELAQPFPPRGFAAVFEHRKSDGTIRYVRTSKVKRVLTRERIARLDSRFDGEWPR